MAPLIREPVCSLSNRGRTLFVFLCHFTDLECLLITTYSANMFKNERTDSFFIFFFFLSGEVGARMSQIDGAPPLFFGGTALLTFKTGHLETLI